MPSNDPYGVAPRRSNPGLPPGATLGPVTVRPGSGLDRGLRWLGQLAAPAPAAQGRTNIDPYGAGRRKPPIGSLPPWARQPAQYPDGIPTGVGGGNAGGSRDRPTPPSDPGPAPASAPYRGPAPGQGAPVPIVQGSRAQGQASEASRMVQQYGGGSYQPAASAAAIDAARNRGEAAKSYRDAGGLSTPSSSNPASESYWEGADIQAWSKANPELANRLRRRHGLSDLGPDGRPQGAAFDTQKAFGFDGAAVFANDAAPKIGFSEAAKLDLGQGYSVPENAYAGSFQQVADTPKVSFTQAGALDFGIKENESWVDTARRLGWNGDTPHLAGSRYDGSAAGAKAFSPQAPAAEVTSTNYADAFTSDGGARAAADFGRAGAMDLGINPTVAAASPTSNVDWSRASQMDFGVQGQTAPANRESNLGGSPLATEENQAIQRAFTNPQTNKLLEDHLRNASLQAPTVDLSRLNLSARPFN